MYTLAPSVFAADYMHLQSQTDKLEAIGVTCLHVDVMDGHFVPNMAFGPDFIRALRKHTNLMLDVHLMIEDPERKIREFAEAGADVLTIHFESCEDPAAVLDMIHGCGIRAGIALKPATALSEIPRTIWEKTDILQIMTVQPGEKGQRFIPAMLGKIRDARRVVNEMDRKIPIEIDGDITAERLDTVVEAGAEILVIGRGIFQGDIEENIRRYRQRREYNEIFSRH